MKRVVYEVLSVLLVGLTIGFAANALSPRGLKLSRNYFPAVQGVTNSVPVPSGQTNHQELVAARLKAAGLQAANTARVKELYEDPRYQQSFVVFIDARDDDKYRAGHIPGAFQFDYYRPERYLATVFPVAQLAHEVVIYCEGGDCEDSQLAAMFLRDNGTPGDKLRVYVGGFKEWSAAGLPVELGERGSGQLARKGSL